MAIKVLGQPSKRKHDNLDLPPIPAAPATDYLTSLEELIAECANHDPTQRLKAAEATGPCRVRRIRQLQNIAVAKLRAALSKKETPPPKPVTASTNHA
jgi:hypothetical protein